MSIHDPPKWVMFFEAGPLHISRAKGEPPKPLTPDAAKGSKNASSSPPESKPKLRARVAKAVDDSMDGGGAAVSSAAEEDAEEGEEGVDPDEELEEEEGVASQK